MQLTDQEINCLHDVVLGASGKNLDDEQLQQLFENLPEEFQNDVQHWGLNDSVVRDNIYEYIENNPEEFFTDSEIDF